MKTVSPYPSLNLNRGRRNFVTVDMLGHGGMTEGPTVSFVRYYFTYYRAIVTRSVQ